MQHPPVIVTEVPFPPDAPQVFFPPSPVWWHTLPPAVVLLITVAVVVGTVQLFGPLLRAIARRIERGPGGLAGGADDLRERLAALEARLAEGGDDQADGPEMQLYHLEERVEFMERLLTRGEGMPK